MPTPASQPIPDLVTLAIALIAGLLGEQASHLAPMLGPYSVIVLFGLPAAAFAVSNAPPASRARTALQILGMVGLALAGTVPLAEVLSRVTGINVRWLIAPVAVLIAARPDLVLGHIKHWWHSTRGGPKPSQDGSEP